MINLDTLAQERAQHQARADQLAAELAQHQVDTEAAQRAERDTQDRQVIDTYQQRETELMDEEKRARDAFHAAVLADPLIASWIEYRALRERRRVLRDSVTNAIVRSGSTVRPPSELRYTHPRLLEDIVTFAEQEARAIADEASA